MLLGTGLAFYLGKPLIQPQAAQIPAIPLGLAGGRAAGRHRLGAAGQRAVPVGVVLAVALWWALKNTGWG
jgi:simple sugar transport system permease protein